jgi:hypothetical protein
MRRVGPTITLALFSLAALGGTSPALAQEGAKSNDAPDYEVKLRELEERIVNLRLEAKKRSEQIQLLKKRVIENVVSEAKVVILHKEDMGGSLKLRTIRYVLDGEQIANRTDAKGSLSEQKQLDIFSDVLKPSLHNLEVEMLYEGDSVFFSYLDDYKLKIRGTFTFYATRGKITTVQAIGTLGKDFTYDITQRATIVFKVDQVDFKEPHPDATGTPPPAEAP